MSTLLDWWVVVSTLELKHQTAAGQRLTGEKCIVSNCEIERVLEERAGKKQTLWCCTAAWAVAFQTINRQRCGGGGAFTQVIICASAHTHCEMLQKGFWPTKKRILHAPRLHVLISGDLIICIFALYWDDLWTSLIYQYSARVRILIQPLHWSVVCYFSHSIKCYSSPSLFVSWKKTSYSLWVTPPPHTHTPCNPENLP